SSREAMAWHKADHRGAYTNKGCRSVTLFFYPKPWEAMRIGPRASSATQDSPDSPVAPDDEIVHVVPEVLEVSPPAVLLDPRADAFEPASRGPAVGEVPSVELRLADPLDLIAP
ncbi:MAG: hypothetical protein ACF788_13295, partial [Novipirellula sp. JB048]